jgi:hypothetical protein
MNGKMNRSFPLAVQRSRIEQLALGIAVLLATGMWFYMQGVFLPFEREHFAALGRPPDPGDLYPRWYGAHELLLHGRDPYSPEISHEIQTFYYGHPLDTTGVDRGRDEQRFAYPLYVAFFLAPTIWMPFPVVQIVVRCTLAVATAASVLLWLRALRWRLSLIRLLTIVVLTLSSPPLVQGLKLQQLALLVAFFLAACAALLSKGKLFWAGCFLALATSKPQLALLPMIWFLIWATGDWKKRQRLVWGFGGTMAVLIGGAQLVSPGWLPCFLHGLVAYTHYAGMSSLLDAYLTPPVAKPVAAVVLGVLLVFCVHWRRDPAEAPSFFARFSLILAVGTITLPQLLPPFNQVLLLPGVLLLIHRWNELWDRGGIVRAVCGVGAGLVLLPWFAASAIAVTHIVAPIVPLRDVWASPLIMSFGVPPLVAGLLMVLLVGTLAQARAPGPTYP